MSESPLIKLKDLHWQPESDVLKNINCEFFEGKVSGIIGPNGAGKSSLLKSIQGALQTDSGEVRFKDHLLASLSRQEIAKFIAVVPQSTSMLFDLSVFDVVRMALIPQKGLFEFDNAEDKQHIFECLEQTGCEEFVKRKYNSLSGGEQQRVLLARALAQRTEVILLDEPTSHLDVYYQHQILALLQGLGKTVLMTIHDINLAAQYCESVLILKDGECLGQGNPEKVLTSENLTQAFDMPCAVSVNPHNRLPTICFHPASAV